MTYTPPTLTHSGSVGIEGLRDRHTGETAWIVGKGPSLGRLRASDIGPGPVIAINEAIAVVQNLGLPQQVYSFQKEGCEARDENGARPCGSCAQFGWRRDPLVDPYPGIAVVLDQYFASWCFHGRENRYVYETGAFGYGETPHIMSVFEAIPFARYLGASEIVMLCFDAMTAGGSWEGHGDDRHDDDAKATMRENLAWMVPRLIDALAEIPHRYVTPR